jgi:hypothetical protein
MDQGADLPNKLSQGLYQPHQEPFCAALNLGDSARHSVPVDRAELALWGSMRFCAAGCSG